MKPVFTSKSKITGNSKHNPKAKISFIIKDKYSDILGSNSIGSEPSICDTWKEEKSHQGNNNIINHRLRLLKEKRSCQQKWKKSFFFH